MLYAQTHAWLSTAPEEGAPVRGRDGGEYPPLAGGLAVLSALHGVGWITAGGMGPAPVSAQELAAWQAGTGAELGPIDFQDVLTVSRAFVAAYVAYDGHPFESPWSPPLAGNDAEAAAKAQERLWDMIMGVT